MPRTRRHTRTTAAAALATVLIAGLVAGAALAAPGATTSATTATGATTATSATTTATTPAKPAPGRTLSPDSRVSADGVAVIPGLPHPPAISAPAFAVYDATDGVLLAGRDATVPRPTASLAKLITALVVVARRQGTELVTASSAAAKAGDGSEIGMRAGQKYTVDTLLDAMLAHSANDAAIALAENVGGDEASFVELMQQTVRNLKLEHTNVINSTGLDEATTSTSSPSDLYVIAKQAMKDARVRNAVSLPNVTVERPGQKPVTLANRNELLGEYAGVDGVKTGFTDAAGNNAIVRWTSPTPPHHHMYAIVMGAKTNAARWKDERALLDWATPLRASQTITEAGSRIATVPVAGSSKGVGVYVSDDITPSLRPGQKLRERIVVPASLEAPLKAGDDVGRYQLLVDDKVVASSPLYVIKNVRKPTVGDRIRRYAGDWPQAWSSGIDEVQHQGNRFLTYWGLQ